MYKKIVSCILCASILLVGPLLAGRAEAAVRVSYLGPAGTYTEEAARFWFQEGEVMTPKETVNDAIADVLSGRADYAVIPQENTVGGAVVNYVDALISADDAFVVGEVILPISQTLMGVPGATLENIQTVCSHAQGLTHAVFVATCAADRIDDIILQLHEAGLEMVALHDRPEGSALGRYHFVIEMKDPNAITGAQLDAARTLEDVRFAGCFNAVEK